MVVAKETLLVSSSEFQGLHQDVERIKKEIADKKVNFAKSFLRDHFNNRQIGGISSEAEELRIDFLTWKEANTIPQITDSAVRGVIGEMGFADLLDASRANTNKWRRKVQVANRGDFRDFESNEVKQFNFWNQVTGIVLEAVIVDRRESAKAGAVRQAESHLANRRFLLKYTSPKAR